MGLKLKISLHFYYHYIDNKRLTNGRRWIIFFFKSSIDSTFDEARDNCGWVHHDFFFLSFWARVSKVRVQGSGLSCRRRSPELGAVSPPIRTWSGRAQRFLRNRTRALRRQSTTARAVAADRCTRFLFSLRYRPPPVAVLMSLTRRRVARVSRLRDPGGTRAQ